jgi:hypothetical protein
MFFFPNEMNFIIIFIQKNPSHHINHILIVIKPIFTSIYNMNV